MKKGFTLIELLIVIGILAILATATILVLNPAQLFAQARDSQRIADLASVRSALALFTSTVALGAESLDSGAFECETDWGISTTAAGPTKRVAATALAGSNAGVTTVAGAGWVPVDLTAVSGGSPLNALPVDPTNDATYNYQYSCVDSTAPAGQVAQTFEINAEMESTRYGGCDGGDDVEATDGGNANAGGTCYYEVGTDPGLDL